MEITRRHALKIGSLSALAASFSGIVKTAFAQEWSAESFDKTVYEEAYEIVTGGVEPQEGDIKIDAPEIASNGATVPITISTEMENVKTISILVENNPRPYISTFFMNDQIESSISVRIKMRETSNIVAIVDTADGKFIAKQSVKVTAGGCA